MSLNWIFSEIEPCLSGPKRPQDRIKLKDVASVVKSEIGDEPSSLDAISSGSVLIAAITSCTNTSNPTVMVAAGLVAKKANALGLKSKEWVKTSLAPGSKVVTKYLEKSGLLPELETMGFNIVGYGCTTCIGNSGHLILQSPKEFKKIIYLPHQCYLVTEILRGEYILW